MLNFISFILYLYLFVIYDRFSGMIKIQDIVRDIVYSEEEALYSLAKGYMNLSAYAKQIQKEVETRTKKDVKTSGICCGSFSRAEITREDASASSGYKDQ